MIRIVYNLDHRSVSLVSGCKYYVQYKYKDKQTKKHYSQGVMMMSDSLVVISINDWFISQSIAKIADAKSLISR